MLSIPAQRCSELDAEYKQDVIRQRVQNRNSSFLSSGADFGTLSAFAVNGELSPEHGTSAFVSRNHQDLVL
jgi:hypothetical protein